jgi:hypothetical protein
MAKLCRGCQKLVVDREVCDACRRRVLRDPVIPTPRPGVWKAAGFLVALLGVTSTLIGAAVITHRALPWRQALNLETRFPRTTPSLTYQITMVVEQVNRKVYPYSIVPGGAENLDEAKRAMSDPAVKANYAGIDFTKLRQLTLKKNLSGYVSYRWGDKIYWTSKMLTLRPGETVFTDGVNLVRGRCLNCYSPYAMLPIRPDEPTEKVLDTPVEIPVISYSFPRIPVLAPELPPPPEELTPSVPIFPPTSPATPGKSGGGIWFPLVPIIPPIHRHPGLPPSGPLPPVPPPVVVVVTPEPDFRWLLAGLFLILLSIYGVRRSASFRVPTRSTEKLQPGGISVVEP